MDQKVSAKIDVQEAYQVLLKVMRAKRRFMGKIKGNSELGVTKDK